MNRIHLGHLIIVAAFAAIACSDNDEGRTPTECNPACAEGFVCEDGACVMQEQPDAGPVDTGAVTVDGGLDAPDAGFVTVVGLTVTPTSADLLSVNGDRPTAEFSFELQMSDGTSAPADDAEFKVEPTLLGTFTSSTSRFTASGRVGGEGRILAEFGGFRTEARVRVQLQQVIFPNGTSTTTPALFVGSPVDDPSRSADTVYPLDGVVMPQNVAPATIQWLRSAPGDAFRVTIEKPNAEVVTYYQRDADPNFTRSWTVQLDAWRRIAQTEPTQTATLTVDRYEAATGDVIQGRPIRMTFPAAALLGAVYYWDIGVVRIVRIPDGSSVTEAFMPNPPLGCVGCHSVSPNGRYMAGRLGGGDNIGGVYDLTKDLTGAPPPSEFTVTSTTIRWWFSSWNPEGDRMIVSVREQQSGRGLRLMDPFRGQFITDADAQLPAGSNTHPDWAPNGSAIAYVGDANFWGGQNTTGNIYTLPVTGRDTFGAPTQVVDGTSVPGVPAGNAASYPSFTPDSQRIAFAHGNSSRSENGLSALYMVNADGTGLVRLDNACGGTDTTNNFQPRFSPFEQAGYFWLSFLSRRDYGNEDAGTRGRRLQQIWVSAIKVSPAANEDPSAVPYWLPGQRTRSRNISAYWAPRACLELEETCTVDAECCSGACEGEVCVEITDCREVGEPCTDSAQCCDGVLCIDDFCGGI